MRRTGWLLLAACLALAVTVGWVFRQQKAEQSKNAPRRPDALAAGLLAKAGEGWVWTKKDGERAVAEVRASEFEQLTDPPRVNLKNVEVKIFHRDGAGYDFVRSPQAELKADEGSLFADSDVDMTMGLKNDPDARNRLINIKTSGVTYDMQTGKVTTERAAAFVFENSAGSSTGAVYDPALRELIMNANVKLDWAKGARKMHVEAGHLVYREDESKIRLSPWSKLVRETLTLNAGDAVVSLKEGEIELVEAVKAHGDDRQPARLLEYQAEKLTMRFADKNVINRIEAEQNAKIATTSDAGKTTVTARRVDMDFDTPKGESVLKRAIARGDSVVESTPPRTAGRVLKSDVIEMAMRENGEEIDNVVTQSPGEIEFLPKMPADRHRRLNGERMWIRYGAKNQIETFRATKATTWTKGKPKMPDAKTSSEELLATFDGKTGDLALLEQTTNFQYEEGDRRARSSKAKLNQAVEQITLTGAARVWDLAGSTEAARIDLDQKTGNMIAAGKVVSTRLPDKKQKKTPSLVDSSETVQARAEKMTTRDDNKWVRYEGGASMWQGADKIDADVITIDRKNQRLEANGKVYTQTREKPKADAKRQKAAQFTLVRAPELIFNDAEKIAHYKNGVTLQRGDLNVLSKELRAWFSKEDNALERAHADGAVSILQRSADRSRNGSSEHAEYEVEEGRVLLSGGAPVFTDSVKGTTRGQTITWFADNDKLQVDGEAARPTESRLKRKKVGK
ncbi:MAG: LPS export ABC transporter periplasmic protein LptC [Acidobacteria bacterium]|nr:LPS export ABC transporter periplasmic protein LptC [Acidobacteriota bacterium]